MDFEQFGEYASSHICEYTDFYREFDFEQYGSGKEKTLEALFTNKNTFEKPLLLLCFDEEVHSDELMVETRLETTLDENVMLYKMGPFVPHCFPFDEELMMVTIEDKEGNSRKFRFCSEFYSLEEEKDSYPEKWEIVNKILQENNIRVNEFETFLISHQ